MRCETALDCPVCYANVDPHATAVNRQLTTFSSIFEHAIRRAQNYYSSHRARECSSVLTLLNVLMSMCSGFIQTAHRHGQTVVTYIHGMETPVRSLWLILPLVATQPFRCSVGFLLHTGACLTWFNVFLSVCFPSLAPIFCTNSSYWTLDSYYEHHWRKVDANNCC